MIRLFDPQRDTKQMLLDLWNDIHGTTLFTLAHFERLNLENVIIVEEENALVGFAFLLDGGLPFAVLDRIYVRPRYNRFVTLRDLLRFTDELCASRGIRWFYGILNGSGGEAEQSVDLLKRRAQWKAQYLGERPMLCRPIQA